MVLKQTTDNEKKKKMVASRFFQEFFFIVITVIISGGRVQAQSTSSSPSDTPSQDLRPPSSPFRQSFSQLVGGSTYRYADGLTLEKRLRCRPRGLQIPQRPGVSSSSASSSRQGSSNNRLFVRNLQKGNGKGSGIVRYVLWIEQIERCLFTHKLFRLQELEEKLALY